MGSRLLYKDIRESPSSVTLPSPCFQNTFQVTSISSKQRVAMAGKEQFLSQKYEKWSKFEIDSDSDDEGAAVPRVPTQFDVEGDADIVVSTELLLTQAQVERYKKLEKKQLEVWQIVVRKLRVWSASSSGADDGDNAVPCRPYCILVNNLYPLGQVVSKKICDPPEVYPSPKTVLDLTLHAMVEPPSNTPQHRPDKIVFPDKNFVGQLRKSYAALNIECSYLSESEGIDAYIQELSNHLVRNDLASVAEVSSRPGMKTGSGITTELLRGFYAACAEYAELEPWNKLAERQALQVDAVGDDELRIDKRHHVGRGTIFTSVIGTKTADAHIRGLALFYTRADLERRVLPRGEKLALLENPELRRCAFCDKKAAAGKELKRCTRCKSTFYCGAACQRGHWPDHKISCMPADSATTAGGPIKWGVKEISILYGPLTSVPFDDLDDIDKHGFAIANLRGEKMYPSAVVFRKGEPDVADATELVWLTRALNAQIGLLKKHPLFMQETMIDLLGLEEVDGEDRQRKVELQVSTLGNDDYLVIRNSTVLTMDDVERLRAAVKRHEAAAPASGEDESPAPVTSSEAAVDAAEAKPRASSASVDEDENDDEGKACSVM